MRISRLCSSKQLTNFSVIVRTLNKSTSITINQLWLSSKLNIKRNCTRFRSNCRFKVTSIKHSSIDLKKITKIWMRDLKSVPRVISPSKVDLKKNWRDLLKREIDWQKILILLRTKGIKRSMKWKNNSIGRKNCLSRRILIYNKSLSKLSLSKPRWS